MERKYEIKKEKIIFWVSFKTLFLSNRKMNEKMA